MQPAPTVTSTARCPSCGQIPSPPERAHCGMCGTPLRSIQHQVERGSTADLRAPNGPRSFGIHGASPKELSERAQGLQFLLIGIPVAYLFAITPMVQFMGWFLASLFHEFGHASAGWFMGFPSVPAISLSGHAAAVHGEAMLIVRVASFAAAVGVLRWLWTDARFIIATCALAAFYSGLIFTPLGEILFLTSGHLGELAAGGLCLWRALSDDACHHKAERLAYAMLGWFLCGRNIVLGFSLAFSAGARADYGSNGSFGLVNDYIRLAQEQLGVELPSVGLIMGVVALVVPAAIVAAFSLRIPRTSR